MTMRVTIHFTNMNTLEYSNDIESYILDSGEVLEVDTTPKKIIYFHKEESIMDTLYQSALEQRADRIENEHTKWGEPKNK